MARLDRLATVKALAQLGATLGREFSYDLLQAVAPWEEETLQQGLHQLVEAEFLYQQGLPPKATYLFKHALIQDAAYQSLLRSTRQQHHQHIAQVLEARFPKLCTTQPELLAYHYTEAGFTAQAIPYWQRAGEQASERSANVEAVNHLTRGLALLTSLPDTPERTQRELAFHLSLGAQLAVTKGYAAPEVEQAFARARALCQQEEDTPQLGLVLWGLYRFYFMRAEHRTAQELAAQLLRLAQHDLAPSLLLAAHAALGTALWVQGHLTAAREHLVPELPRVEAQQRRELAFRYGVEPEVLRLMYTAIDLWFLGYADAALQRLQTMFTLAQELAHPFNLVVAQGGAAWLQRCRRDIPETQARAEAALTLATEQGNPYWMATGALLRGWARTAQGQAEEGIAHMQQGLTAYRATGAELFGPFWLAMLAEAYGEVGQTEAGLIVLAEALAVVDKTGERFWEAELYRLKGKLLLSQASHIGEVEACLRQALDIARHQEAKSLELRAAMSLARLRQQQGKRQEAHDLLAPVYHWFTEGFDTADLKEAKALLDALA
jgi:predicted ATPase